MTLKDILQSKNPGKKIKKKIEGFPGKFNNIKNSGLKYVDPITFIHSLYHSGVKISFLKELDHEKDVYAKEFIYSFQSAVKNRSKGDTKLLWQLASALYHGKKWKKLFRRASEEVYCVDIESLSALAHFMNPSKFKFISKIERLSGYSIEDYLREY